MARLVSESLHFKFHLHLNKCFSGSHRYDISLESEKCTFIQCIVWGSGVYSHHGPCTEGREQFVEFVLFMRIVKAELRSIDYVASFYNH